MRALFLICLLTMAGPWSSAQRDTLSLRLLARARPDGIALRWAPLDHASWQAGIRRGYCLERVTIGRHQTYLDEVQQQASRLILAERLLPWPESDWPALTDTNQIAIVAAASLYSSSFEVKDRIGEAGALYDTGQEADNRFGFALFAADQFLDVACAMGLGLVDRTVRPGETYLYTISFSGPAEAKEEVVGQAAAASGEWQPLPAPDELSAKWGHRRVQLRWNRALNISHYTAYYVERSVDRGQRFQRVNRLPLVYFTPPGTEDDYMYFVDTLSTNDSTYFYRVRGVSPFGEWGPPSTVVSGRGRPGPLPYAPYIKELVETTVGKLRISWSVPAEALGRMAGFNVYRAPEPTGPFILLTEEALPASTYTYTDEAPQATAYYLVKLIDPHGHEVGNNYRLALLHDHDPPAPPRGLRGVMNKAGEVSLHWSPNTEDDFRAYRVYIANQEDGDFLQITPEAIPDTTFRYTVSVQTGSEAVYFRLKGVDYRGNYSAFSDPVRIARPDLRPPTAPNITVLQARPEGVYLEWAASSSQDVVRHELQRKAFDSANWQTLASWAEEMPTTHLDGTAEVGRVYHYRLRVLDDAGLDSYSPMVQAGRIDDRQRGAIEDFAASPSDSPSATILLQWRYSHWKDVSRFLLYRAQADAPISTYRSLAVDVLTLTGTGYLQWRDTEVAAGRTYRYRLLAHHHDGAYSDLTEEMSAGIR